MKVGVLLAAFVLGTIFDITMSIIGISIILESQTYLSLTMCGAMALALLALRLSMDTIRKSEGALFACLRFALFFSIGFDAFATASGVAVHIIGKDSIENLNLAAWSSLYQTTSWPVLIFSGALVVFMVFSPMVVSYLWTNKVFENMRIFNRATILTKTPRSMNESSSERDRMVSR